MKQTIALLVGSVALTAGCAETPHAAAPAPATFVTHVEAAPWTDFERSGSTGSVAVGVEDSGCCAGGLYVATTAGLPKLEAEDETLAFLEGGFEGVIVPDTRGRLRLRARFGVAGTRPKKPLLGRSGIGTSGAVLLRLTEPTPPAVTHFAPTIDVFAGCAFWFLGAERSAAGSYGKDVEQGAFMLGLRVGTAYGVDFE